jgi:hypothetical protein
VRLTLVVVMTLPPRHLIRLNVLFLPGLHIFGGLARFDQNLAFFFVSLFSFFFFLKSRVGHAKTHISLSIYLFSLDLVLLLFAIFCIYIDYF